MGSPQCLGRTQSIGDSFRVGFPTKKLFVSQLPCFSVSWVFDQSGPAKSGKKVQSISNFEDVCKVGPLLVPAINRGLGHRDHLLAFWQSWDRNVPVGSMVCLVIVSPSRLMVSVKDLEKSKYQFFCQLGRFEIFLGCR